MRICTIAAILGGLAVAGCGGSSSGSHQQQGNQPCGTVSGTVNGNIIDSAGGSCEVTWATASTGMGMYGIGTSRSLDSDTMSFSDLTISIAANAGPTLGGLSLTDTYEGAVSLNMGPMLDELLIAEKAANIMTGSASLNITSIEPSDGISSTVHGTLTAHLGVPVGVTQYSGTADVDMTF